MAFPVSDTRELDTLVTSAIDTISGNPANLVNEGGEKLLGKLAKRGRIFRVNDAERVEHPVMYSTDASAWEANLGDQYSGTPTSGTTLTATQNEVLTKALFDIVTKTKNFNVPQSIIGRDSQLAMSDIAYLAQRMAMETYAEEEALLLLGQTDLTAGGDLNPLAPYRGDNDFFNRGGTSTYADFGSMSMLGLFDSGRDTGSRGQTFAGIAPNDDTDWEAQLFTASNAAPSTSAELDQFLADVQEAIIRTDFGGMERPTDILSTIDWYSKFLEALRSKGTINDTLIRDMGVGPNTEIPFGSVLVDYSRHLDADNQWDLTVGSPAAVHPVMGLNLNSLRWNLVGQTTGVGADAGWIQQKSEMAPHPTLTNFFKRLEYRSCFSLDNGRRSNFLIKGWTL